jgi:microcin C transport system permease protein
VNPVWQRRFARFRRNRRAVWSGRLLLLLCLLCMAADILATDRPLLVRYQGELYAPVLQAYPETTFGGFLPTETDFHDPWIQRHIADHGWILWAPIPFGPRTIDFSLDQAVPAPPSRRHLLGTDDVGRDVAARMLHGMRISLVFAAVVAAASVAIGVGVGAMQGYFGGLVDLLGQRLLEVWSGIPGLFVLILLASVVEPSFWWLLAVTMLFSWMTLVDPVRAEFLRGRTLDYVRAAQAMGVPHGRIMLRHILPNAMVAALTFLPFVASGAITTLTSLDFLGFGLPPGSPSLGELLSQGKNNLQAPWLGLASFGALAALLSLLVFLGEGVRDAFDPHAQD